VAFSYRRPGKPQIFDAGSVKLQFDVLGREIYEGDQSQWWQEVADPEVVELQTQVKLLQNSVRRLESLIPARELPQVGKEVKQRVSEDGRDSPAGIGTGVSAEEVIEETIAEQE